MLTDEGYLGWIVPSRREIDTRKYIEQHFNMEKAEEYGAEKYAALLLSPLDEQFYFVGEKAVDVVLSLMEKQIAA